MTVALTHVNLILYHMLSSWILMQCKFRSQMVMRYTTSEKHLHNNNNMVMNGYSWMHKYKKWLHIYFNLSQSNLSVLTPRYGPEWISPDLIQPAISVHVIARPPSFLFPLAIIWYVGDVYFNFSWYSRRLLFKFLNLQNWSVLFSKTNLYVEP